MPSDRTSSVGRKRSTRGSTPRIPVPAPDTSSSGSVPSTPADLVERIMPENRHDEVDWGATVGKEIW